MAMPLKYETLVAVAQLRALLSHRQTFDRHQRETPGRRGGSKYQKGRLDLAMRSGELGLNPMFCIVDRLNGQIAKLLAPALAQRTQYGDAIDCRCT
jgi:hypothetical protein